MLYSNNLPKQVKTDFCTGRPVQFNGNDCYLISYTSRHVKNGLFEITSALICFQGKTEIIKGKKVTNAVFMQLRGNDIANLTLPQTINK